MGLAVDVHDVLGEGLVARGACEVLLQVLVALPLDRLVARTELDTGLVAARLSRGASLEDNR